MSIFGTRPALEPKMRTYIFTARNGIHIIDLQKEASGLLDEAGDFVRGVAASGRRCSSSAEEARAGNHSHGGGSLRHVTSSTAMDGRHAPHTSAL